MTRRDSLSHQTISGDDVVRALVTAGFVLVDEAPDGVLLSRDGAELRVPRRTDLSASELTSLLARSKMLPLELAASLQPIEGDTPAPARSNASVPPAPKTKVTRSGVRARVRRALVIDDADDERRMYASEMRENGWLVEETAAPVEAMGMAREFKPDVIITDLSMPELDGNTLILRLKGDAETKNIPIVVLTGFSERAGLAYLAGCHTFLCKPCLPQTLLEIVNIISQHPPDDRAATSSM